jgi:hypothetical protein
VEAYEVTPEQIEEEISRRARKEMLKRGRAVDWRPLDGPQTRALESEADETFYGGAAGGGKSDMLLGCAMTQHQDAIVFRREYPQLRGLVKRSRQIVGTSGTFNQTEMVWSLADDRTLEFGAVQHATDVEKYRGRPHDFIGFDEAANFTEEMVVFLSGWLRTTIPDQRCRIVYASNPPTDTEGEWLIRRFAPWLDEQHPNPAEPGELRWFAAIDGKDTEVADGTPFDHNGETIIPLSRTFIPALVGDNPYLSGTKYVATLQAMPEPLRSQLLYGDFSIGLQDHEWQVIPTAWVRAAQDRWTEQRPKGSKQEQIGADVAQGGADNTVIARRYTGNWFAKPEIHPGVSVPDAQHNADHIERALRYGGFAQIDSDGIGASTYHLLVPKVTRQRVRAFKGSGKTKVKDRAKVLTFANVRAAAWWAMRDALDPAYGSTVALPPLRDLRVDLCSARYETQTNGIKLEDKDDIKDRIGRSPDLGDTYVMANWRGPSMIGVLSRSMQQRTPAPSLTALSPHQTNASTPEHERQAERDRPPRRISLLGRRGVR